MHSLSLHKWYYICYNDTVQFTGIGTGTDTYHRITGVTARNSVSIARTTGDPVITSPTISILVTDHLLHSLHLVILLPQMVMD